VKITVITPYLPYPGVPHGGGRDLFHLIAFFGRRHAVTVISFADAAQAAHADALRPHVTGLRVIRPAVTPRQKAASLIRAVGSGGLKALGRRAAGELRAAVAEAGGDVLYGAWTEMGRYLDAAPPGCVTVLDEVDVRFVVEEQAGRRDAAARKAEELRYCRAADLVVTRSARDLAALRAHVPDLRGVVLPPVGHTAELLAIRPEESLPGRVLFVGAMDRERNQGAVRWLVEAIWPRVRAEYPGAELRIAGANPPPELRALDGREGVTVTGWVDDLREEYARARVVVAPMRSEAGALNKVIDGLAAGRPVVATAAANAGVGAPEDAIRLADDAEGFARAVCDLLSDDRARDRMGRAARRFARETFDWPPAAARLEAELERLVGR
jgi:glycosyltransferase involved in cell wall biosynthesis